MINSTLYINTDCVEVVNIVGQYTDKYKDIQKAHSKGEAFKVFWFFTDHYKEDLYAVPYLSYDVNKKEILKYINQKAVEFGSDGEIYYKPHIEITFKGSNGRKLNKYFDTEQELKAFFDYELVPKLDFSKMLIIDYNNVLKPLSVDLEN